MSAATIKLLADESIPITIFNAVCRHTKSSDILKKFGITPDGDNTKVDVELLVNGVSVPLLPTLTDYFKRFDELVSKEASKRVIEMVDGTACGGIVDVIDKITTLLNESRSVARCELKKWMDNKGQYTGHLDND